jgi:hypothetical protein
MSCERFYALRGVHVPWQQTDGINQRQTGKGIGTETNGQGTDGLRAFDIKQREADKRDWERTNGQGTDVINQGKRAINRRYQPGRNGHTD